MSAEPIIYINMKLSKIFKDTLFETVDQKSPQVVYFAPIKSSSVFREHKERHTTHHYEDETIIFVNRLSAKGVF